MIRSFQINLVRTFYQGLGLEFIEEQHGNGPVHYSYSQDQLVIEIYPGTEGSILSWKESGALMFGFFVEDINKIIDSIESLKGKVISHRNETERGYRAVLEDPEGRRIEIIEYKN